MVGKTDTTKKNFWSKNLVRELEFWDCILCFDSIDCSGIVNKIYL